MVLSEVTSMTENTCWDGLDLIFKQLLHCELKESIKAFYFLKLDLIDHRWS
jgi:hypothetical protein